MSAYEHNQEFVIDDPDELSQKQRVRELLDRRTDVLEARNRGKDEELLGAADYMVSLGHYQNHLESLIMDLWTKLTEREDGEEYLHDKHIATITVQPPDELIPGNNSDFAPGETAPDPKTVSIHGLKWFVNNEPAVSQTFTAQMWNPPRTVTKANTRPLPRSALDKATTLCFEFMNEADIDASVGGEDGDAGFTYEEMVNKEMLRNGDGDE
jgi:hypothetical protein